MKKRFGPRDELIDKVQHGKLTPAQAEAEALRLGLGPFAKCPDPDRFDPMAEAWWSLPMAVAGSLGDHRIEFANTGTPTARNAGIGISASGEWVLTAPFTRASFWSSAVQRRLFASIYLKATSTLTMKRPIRS
jgi:hypothetical protein